MHYNCHTSTLIMMDRNQTEQPTVSTLPKLEEIEEENDDDRDDVFGVEEKGFCCFTNSVVIIYL